MRRVFTVAMLSIACWAASLTPGSAQNDYFVTVNLMDADLLTAIKAISQQVDVQVIFEPTDKPYSKIALLQIKNQPFEQALSYICQSAGAQYRKESSGVYVIGPVKPEAETKMETIPVKTTEFIPAPRPVQTVLTEKIYLKYSRPTDLVRIMKSEWHTDDPFAELREFTARVVGDSTRLQTVRPAAPMRMDGAPVAYPPNLQNGAPNNNNLPVNGDPNQTDLGDGQFTGRGGGQPGGGGFRGGGFGGGQPGGGGFGGGFGGGQPGGGGFGGGQPGGGGGAAGNPLLPSGSTVDILGFDPDNSIIVRGTAEDIEYIRRIVRFLDIAPKQVLIRAEFVTVNRSELDNFGIDWNLARVNLTAGATGFANRTSPVFVNYATGNVIANLRALLSETRGKVVNAPIVTTMNNTPAAVFFTTNDYIIQQVVVFDQNGRPTTFSQPFPLFATTVLSVTPRINQDGTITLALSPTVTTPGKVQVGNEQLPKFDTQSVFTVRRIKNGETMVIGGLIEKRESNTINKVPILADLPIIGQFFRTRDKSINENELLIFITAEVLPDPLEPIGGGTLNP